MFVVGIYLNIGSNKEDGPLIQDSSVRTKNWDSALESSKQSNNQNQDGQAVTITEGLGTLIGKKTNELIKLYGKPSRMDPSSYGYTWWVYNQKDDYYFQAAVQNGKIVSVYGLGEKLNLYPFSIGQSVEEIYKKNFLETAVDIEWNGSSYRFELSEDDLHMRPLVKLGNVFAQIYLDKYTGKISSIRFSNEETLVKHRPYELTYRGKLAEDVMLTENEWAAVQAGDEKQIFDITNVLRKRYELEPLLWDEKLAEVAFSHSNEMFEENYFSHTSPNEGELADRLKKADVQYEMAGENIAAHYVDGIAAVAGWLNSVGHREAMLNHDFTHLGVGVYNKYYTQNFIRQ
ncbi:CAP domain-containing protein [Peribacillus tepidiphilus]|uniref:CAP domain-containing protein n=1 Tax=Peribacillus tepidiphilus TaxID=2652445 RepID=UPI0012921B67|nr:CAP domain-containing protein [Peribacillus tepidiphilus]